MSTCAGWPNGKKLASTCVQIWARQKSTQVHASRWKPMQVHVSGWPYETQIERKPKTCVDLPVRLTRALESHSSSPCQSNVVWNQRPYRVWSWRSVTPAFQEEVPSTFFICRASRRVLDPLGGKTEARADFSIAGLYLILGVGKEKLSFLWVLCRKKRKRQYKINAMFCLETNPKAEISWGASNKKIPTIVSWNTYKYWLAKLISWSEKSRSSGYFCCVYRSGDCVRVKKFFRKFPWN